MTKDAVAPWPLELVIKRSAKVLSVAFEDGNRFDIAFELLRVESPSAQVQGHSAADKKVVIGKGDVLILRAEPVGRYAVRLIFDDGHDSGIFTWDWLYRLGRDQENLLAAYRLAVSKLNAGTV
jgi:DUF971 family protein